MAKWKTALQRRRELAAHIERSSARPLSATETAYHAALDPNDWATGWDKDARLALRLHREDAKAGDRGLFGPLDDDGARELNRSNKASNDILRRAFELHRLNINNPGDWRLLIMQYAMVEHGFPRVRRAGAPRKPTADFERDALAGLEKLRAKHGPEYRITHEMLARELAKIRRWRGPGNGPNAGIAGIRKRLTGLNLRKK